MPTTPLKYSWAISVDHIYLGPQVKAALKSKVWTCHHQRACYLISLLSFIILLLVIIYFNLSWRVASFDKYTTTFCTWVFTVYVYGLWSTSSFTLQTKCAFNNKSLITWLNGLWEQFVNTRNSLTYIEISIEIKDR